MKTNHGQLYSGKTDILQYALALMAINGGTTTKEVKLAMRHDNYWLRQEEVSIAMNELARQLRWDIEETGMFRIYRLPGTQQTQQIGQSQTSVDPLAKIDAQLIGVTLIKTAGGNDNGADSVQFTTTPKRGDWFCFDYTDPKKPETFVTGTDKRNVAKYFYSKELNSEYAWVGANEIR